MPELLLMPHEHLAHAVVGALGQQALELAQGAAGLSLQIGWPGQPACLLWA